MYTETHAHEKSLAEKEIAVQVLVIQRLHLASDANASAIRYASDGYAAKCRELMETDPYIQELLKQGKIDTAAEILTSQLEAWKSDQSAKTAASSS